MSALRTAKTRFVRWSACPPIRPFWRTISNHSKGGWRTPPSRRRLADHH